MKKQYLISKSELVLIPTPEDYNDLIGKYYLHKLKNGKNCFYRITGYKYWTDNPSILLYSALNGTFPYRCFHLDNLPPFYELKKTDTEILFNVWE